MQLALFTAPTILPGEPSTVNRLFDSGLPLLHLRKPDASAAALRAYLQQLEPRHLARVVLHQHHELADEFPLKGIHFKERDRPPPPLSRARPGLSQSTSLHSLADVRADWRALDYAFLSPIFDSISKRGYSAAGFDPDELAATLGAARMPVYALGGITPERLPHVRRLGFAGVGVLGSVWAADDPVAALRQFQDAL